jgi:hypothetical protein
VAVSITIDLSELRSLTQANVEDAVEEALEAALPAVVRHVQQQTPSLTGETRDAVTGRAGRAELAVVIEPPADAYWHVLQRVYPRLRPERLTPAITRIVSAEITRSLSDALRPRR